MIIHVVAGLIRRGDQVLLVQQQGPEDAESSWALPGGRVEPGELLTEALVREVAEETGLVVEDPGSILYMMHQYDDQLEVIAIVFAVERASGHVVSADPDNLIRDARFMPVAEVFDLMDTLPWRTMREPYIAALRGEVSPGAFWAYRDDLLVVDPRRPLPVEHTTATQ